MRISFVQPRPELQPYVESFWVFESAVGIPPSDTSMAAPNGCLKLVVAYENSLVSTADGRTQISHQQGLYFVGNRDTSTVLHSAARKSGFIVIKFAPQGAYPFFGMHFLTSPLAKMETAVESANCEKFPHENKIIFKDRTQFMYPSK